jgi:hypothetical protein
MSGNQFILQSAKIESKPNVGRKRIKEKGGTKKKSRRLFQYDRSFGWLQGVSVGED